MSKLTYIFKADYANRKPEHKFIKSILDRFSCDEVTGIGLKVNNNLWCFEFFIFITIDTDFLIRDTFDAWLKENFKSKSIFHNVFLNELQIRGGNIMTFINSKQLELLNLFDGNRNTIFLFPEFFAKILQGKNNKEVHKCLMNLSKEEFESKNPQYKEAIKQKPNVFISHSSLSKNMAKNISDFLCTKEIPIWLDRNEINLDRSNNEDEKSYITKKINDGISICDVGLFILTNDFFKKYWTKLEVSICEDLNKKILLLIYEENIENDLYDKIILKYPSIRIDDGNIEDIIKYI